MLNLRNVFIFFLGITLVGCSAKEIVAKNTPTRTEKLVREAADRERRGESTGPISLTYKQLSLKEIAEHLDMDEATAKLHLKATNIHGYYSLLAKNYPPGVEFILYHIDLAGKISSSKRFFVNGNGDLITTMDDIYIELENNFLFFSNYLRGEPAEFVLASTDERYCAAARIIPNPIEAIDNKKRRVSVEIASSDKREYNVYCSGCKPYGRYILTTCFENEKFVNTLEANQNGEMFQMTGPTAPWVTGGDATIELRGEAMQNPIIVNYRWGA